MSLINKALAPLSEKEKRTMALKLLIKQEYGTLSNFAKELGYSRVTLFRVLNGEWRTRAIQEALSDLADTDVDALFPENEAA